MISPVSKIAESFSAAQASEFSGLSMAMLNYLVRAKIVTPTAGRKRGRGIQRKFSFGDIVVLKTVTKLLEGGVSVYRLRGALASFRKLHSDITPRGIPAAYLVTDGKDVFLRHRTGVLELLISRQFAFAFVVEVDSLRREAVAFAGKSMPQLANRKLEGQKRLRSSRAN